MLYLLPLPDADGIAKTQAHFLHRYGRTVTCEEAADILARVMKHLYLTSAAFSDDTANKQKAAPTSNPSP